MKKDFSANQNYQNLLTKGRELFWKYGIRRVTVEEICKEAGMSKMTFYKFFPNKIELAKTILTQIMESALEEFQALVMSNMPFHDKVQKIFVMKLKGTMGISAEFLNDII